MNAILWLIFWDGIGYGITRVLLSLLWQSALLLCMVRVLVYILRNRSESLRYNLWVTAILIIPLLPLFTWGISQIGTYQTQLTVIPAYSTPQVTTNQSTQQSRQTGKIFTHESELNFPKEQIETTPGDIQNPIPVHYIQPAGEKEYSVWDILLLLKNYPWALAFGVYSIVAASFLTWIFIGRIHIRSWILHSEAVVDFTVYDIFGRVCRQLGITRDVLIVENKDIRAPLACRTFRPVVILPAGISQTLTADEIEAVAIHELSHVRRNDMLILTIVSVIRALLFFHPLIWYASGEVSFLAESSCDSAVLETTGKPLFYADMLSRMARNLPNRMAATELAMGMAFSKSMFFRRITSILSDNRGKIKKLSRKALVGLVLLSIFSLIAILVFPLGNKDNTDSETVTVTGKVLHNGKPVANAEIYMVKRNIYGFGLTTEKIALCHKNGSFRFTSQRSELYKYGRVNASIAAFIDQYAIGWHQIDSIEDCKNITITLTDYENINGIVKNREGKPVDNAEVYIYALNEKQSYNPASSRITVEGTLPGTTTHTNAQGWFQLKHIPKGASGGLFIKGPGYAQEYLQSVQAGSDSISVILEPEGRIEGKIIYSGTGKSAEDLHLIAIGGHSVGESAYTDVEQDGHFEFTNLKEGLYDIIMSTNNEFPEWISEVTKNVEVTAGNTTIGVEVTMIKGGVISGRATDADTGEPIEGLFIGRGGFTDEEGYFKSRVPPGDITVYSHSQQGYELVSAREKVVTIAEGETISNIDFQFERGIDLKGTARTVDDKPVDNAIISFSSRADGSMMQKSVKTDKKGRFTIEGLSKGLELSLTAVQEALQLKASVDVEIQPGTEIDIIMEKYGTTSIEGTIFDSDGKPAPGIEIFLVRWGEGPGTGMSSVATVSDVSGNFKISGLKVGNDYSIHDKNNQARSERFTAEENLPSIELKLPKADRWLEGYVYFDGGKPIVKARVIINGSTSGHKETYTNSKGYYRLEGLVAKYEDISINREDSDWYRFKYVLTNRQHDFTLFKGERYLEGKITDVDGKPLSGVYVRINEELDLNPSYPQPANGRSDRDGKFRINGLFNEKVHVSLSLNNYGYKEINNVETNRKDAVFVLEKTHETVEESQKSDSYESPPKIGSYESVYIPGRAAVKIDGDLSDWKTLNLKKEYVCYTDPQMAKRHRYLFSPSPDDLSVYFQCFADENYVYMAFDVIDDTFMPGTYPWGYTFCDDSIEIMPFGDRKELRDNEHVPNGQIWIATDSNLQTRIEGRDPIVLEKIPLVWKELGVEAVMKEADSGYTVECAIPWSALELSGWRKNGENMLDFRVYDRDNKGVAQTFVELASNPDEDHILITFKAPEGKEKAEISYRSENYGVISGALWDMKEGKWEDAEKKLVDAGNVPWVKPLLAFNYEKSGSVSKQFNSLVDLAGLADDSIIKSWACQTLYTETRRMQQTGNPDTKDIITLFEKVMKYPVKDLYYYYIKLSLAGYYLNDGRLRDAKQIGNDMLASEELSELDNDLRITRDARMLLDSVELALSQAK